MSTIMYDVMEIPEFVEEVKRIYAKRLSGKCGAINEIIMNNAKKIDNVVDYDNRKWGISNYEDELKWMTNWVDQRCDYFEEVYGR